MKITRLQIAVLLLGGFTFAWAPLFAVINALDGNWWGVALQSAVFAIWVFIVVAHVRVIVSTRPSLNTTTFKEK